MTALNQISQHLSRRKTAASSQEIAYGTRVNPHTVRRVIASHNCFGTGRMEFVIRPRRVCRITGSRVKTFALVPDYVRELAGRAHRSDSDSRSRVSSQ